MEEVKKEKKVRKPKPKQTDLSFEFAQRLEEHFQGMQKEYFDAHKALSQFATKDLPDEIIFTEENRDEVNKALERIQDVFMYGLHPILSWIATRYQPALNLTNGYEEFISNLEKAGATKIDPQGNIIKSTDVEAARAAQSPLVH